MEFIYKETTSLLVIQLSLVTNHPWPRRWKHFIAVRRVHKRGFANGFVATTTAFAVLVFAAGCLFLAIFNS